MRQLRALIRYWNQHPPAHELLWPIAQFVGVRRPGDEPEPEHQARRDGHRSAVPPHMKTPEPTVKLGPEAVGAPVTNMHAFGMTFTKKNKPAFNPINFDFKT